MTSIARRIAAVSAATVLVTALVSALALSLVLRLRLTALDARTAEELAEAVEVRIGREKAEQPTLARAVEEVLAEATLAGARIEVWDGTRLSGSRGPGSPCGASGGPTDGKARRVEGRLVVRRRDASGLVVVVAVPASFSRSLRREVGFAVLLGVVPLALLAAAVSAALTRRSLEPLASLARQVAARPPSSTFTPFTAPSRDVELARLTDALNESGARLARALATERELAAYASHALRTPLTRLALLVGDGDDPAARSVRSLRRLVESLLLLSRGDAPKAEAGATVNVADVARRVAASLGPASARLVVAAPDEALVRADEELLEAALGHLVDNALLYAPPDTPIRVAVEASTAPPARVTLSVTDGGRGLAPGEEERVFAPFVRGEAGACVEGNGLGLALVRRIAERHGGRASARGSRFELELPAWAPR